MSSPVRFDGSRRSRDLLMRAARWVLGGMFIYLGLVKALQPVEFLQVVRQYDFFAHHVLLNAVAAILPWFEVFCGLLLVAGVAVRGAALAAGALLISFSGLVFSRAWSLHQAQAIPFCAVRFDCGCGGGEVAICGKLLENVLLIVLAFTVVARRRA